MVKFLYLQCQGRSHHLYQSPLAKYLILSRKCQRPSHRFDQSLEVSWLFHCWKCLEPIHRSTRAQVRWPILCWNADAATPPYLPLQIGWLQTSYLILSRKCQRPSHRFDQSLEVSWLFHFWKCLEPIHRSTRAQVRWPILCCQCWCCHCWCCHTTLLATTDWLTPDIDSLQPHSCRLNPLRYYLCLQHFRRTRAACEQTPCLPLPFLLHPLRLSESSFSSRWATSDSLAGAT